MMKTYRTLLLCLAFMILAQAGFAKQPEREEPLIRVGLLTQRTPVNVSADSDFFLFTDKGSLIRAFSANETVSFTNQDGKITVNGAPIMASVVRIGFSQPESNGHGDWVNHLIAQGTILNKRGHYLKLGSARYRGVLELRRQSKAGLTAVTILPLEQYLYGVIPKEISPSWPLEAIKAQAVAARSYAYANTGKHQDQGFEVCATVHCQVYGGRESEAERSNLAVDATRGVMATYHGAVISAFFHASSGGHTESSENIWGTSFPYLRGVNDFDQKAPRFSWERHVSVAKLTELLKANGSAIGDLTAIELSVLTPQPVVSQDRGLSGRVKTIKLIGANGSVQLSGARFSSLLGLPSSLFDITFAEASMPVATFTKPTARRIVDNPQDIIIIKGKGAGHGIGMSQWGAKFMAEQAPPDNNQYYKEILTHYYLGTTIERWYK